MARIVQTFNSLLATGEDENGALCTSELWADCVWEPTAEGIAAARKSFPESRYRLVEVVDDGE